MSELPDLFGKLRDPLLECAIDLTKKWCVPPDEYVNRNRRSDQFWIEILDKQGPPRLDGAIARQFLVGFQLNNRVSWDVDKVADAMRRARTCTGDAVTVVSSLVSTLKLANRRNTQQTSAASKIAFFAQPHLEIYIWDRLVTKSARFRMWHAGACSQRLRLGVYLDANRKHAYGEYWKSCKAALNQEHESRDFNKAKRQLVEHFRKISGPMSDVNLTPDEFIERRLLDKLMFCEGLALEGKDFKQYV